MNTDSARGLRRPAAFALAITLVGAFGGPVSAADLLARTDRSEMLLGETVVLTLTASPDDAGTAEPDLTPLETDFDVRRSITSDMTRIVNGHRSDTRSWIVTLAPKRGGRLSVPALGVGRATSAALVIDVGDAPELGVDGAASAPVVLKLSVAEGTHHVHEEIPVTLRISDSIGLLDATLEEPASEHFTLTHTGEDRTRQIAGAAGPVSVTERHYVLRPREAGELVLPALTLHARVSDPSARHSPFAGAALPRLFANAGFGRDPFARLFDRGRELTVRSAPVSIEVLEQPLDGGRWFLPARRVELQDEWSSAEPSFRVGEATRRTVRLVALGASAEQLPRLSLTAPEGVKVYVDATRDRTVETPEGSAAVLEMEFSIVPTRTGEIRLPAIEVDWWDTASDVERVAALAARDIRVLPAAGETGVPTSSAGEIPRPASRVEAGEEVATSASPTSPRPGWAVALGLASIAGAGGVWLRRRARRDAASPDASHDSSLARELERACRANEPLRALRAVRQWLASVGGVPTRGIDAMHGAAASELGVELARLERALYAGVSPGAWDGGALLAAFRRAKRSRVRTMRSTDERYRVPPLYPI